MSETSEIRNKALELLKLNPSGIRNAELMRKIREALPGKNPNTIAGATWDLDATFPKLVYKPERGLFRLTEFATLEPPKLETAMPQPIGKHIKSTPEQDFYKPFAVWLVESGLEDCTNAIPLGGNKFVDKWGTPDVIGINKSAASDVVKHGVEIISVEIKPDTGQLITAFGQACAYRLFSHKVYMVIPKDTPDLDATRIDSLCKMFGIGLVLFKQDPLNPNFEVRVRPAKHEPDMFYVNKYMKLIEAELPFA